MIRNTGGSAIALAFAVGWALPAQAQVADAAAVEQELAQMRAQMAQMAQRIDTLEAQLASARAQAATAQQTAETAAAQVQAEAAKPSPVEVAWKGAPQFRGEGGWSFKPRGRVQVDVGGVDAPAGVAGSGKLGLSTEFRRAYIGFEGTIPGNFGYRLEADIAGSDVQLTDVYLTYKASDQLTFTVGQHKPFWSLEESTSDLFTSMMERAAFNSAFGFERRVGASATYAGDTFVAQAGIFSDDASSLNSDTEKSYSVDGRLVAMPRLAGGTLHLGVSAHVRDLAGSANAVRYRARPFVHTTDLRFVDTGTIDATGERGPGGEIAFISGRFHATGESFWQTVRRRGQPDPTFNGGYAEIGYLLTDDKTAYKNGAFDRIKPASPLGGGGMGALQVNARYDWLDLSDAGIVGGRQRMAGLSLIWIPVEYVRFIANYGHIWLKDAAVAANGDRNYGVDAVGMRTQIDF